MKRVVIFLLIIFIVPSGFAQSNKQSISESSSGGYLYFGIPISTLETEAAKEEGIANHSIGVEFGLVLYFYNYLLAGGNSGIDFPGDKKEFSQMTTGGRMTASVTVPYASLFIGLRTPKIRLKKDTASGFVGNLILGNAWVFNARRSIDECKDCRKDKIHLDAGMYVEPEIDWVYSLGNEFMLGIGVGYKYYFKSDYKRSVVINFFMGR